MLKFILQSGDFTSCTKTLGLKGHNIGEAHSDSVLSFSFTNDSKRVATISKDNSWKIWDIDVDYLKGQVSYSGEQFVNDFQETSTKMFSKSFIYESSVSR